MAPGTYCMTCSAARCGSPPLHTGHTVLGSSIGSRSRPRKQGVHGYDSSQHVNGCKRRLLVETFGWRLVVVVTAASVQDRDGALSLRASLRHRFSRMRRIWADQASAGDLVAWLWELRPWRNIRLAIVQRPAGIKGCLPLPKRWMVEPPCAGLGRDRRFAGVLSVLSRDRLVANLARLGSLCGLSIPVFWQGTMRILLFSLTFRWLPAVVWTPL
jgi:hypothetical protein